MHYLERNNFLLYNIVWYSYNEYGCVNCYAFKKILILHIFIISFNFLRVFLTQKHIFSFVRCNENRWDKTKTSSQKEYFIIKVDCLYAILLRSQRFKTLQLDLHFIVMRKRSAANVERDMEPWEFPHSLWFTKEIRSRTRSS